VRAGARASGLSDDPTPLHEGGSGDVFGFRSWGLLTFTCFAEIPVECGLGRGTGKQGLALARSVLSDAQWERVAPRFSGKWATPAARARTIGAFSKRLLGTARSGSPWRDLHAEFGKWNSGFKRLRRWAVNGVFEKIFATLSGDPDF
jgi:hypothetical protein